LIRCAVCGTLEPGTPQEYNWLMEPSQPKKRGELGLSEKSTRTGPKGVL